MKKPKYQYKADDNFEFFEFYSEGKKGIIKKIVQYQKTSDENVYNLAFGDYDERSNSIDDMSITNNGDSLKVLATVASTVYAFIEKYPNASIIATGSTSVRTRLYRMGITNNLDEISEDFAIFGYTTDEQWVKFEIGDDGKLVISIYTVPEGLGVEPEKATLTELSGDPKAVAVKLVPEVFTDKEHIARAAVHMTLFQLSKLSLKQTIEVALKNTSGNPIDIRNPMVRGKRPVADVIIYKATEDSFYSVTVDLLSGKSTAKKLQ